MQAFFRVLLCLAALASFACAADAPPSFLVASLPREHVVDGTYRAADPSAPAVTLDSLPVSERFWPHQIRLVEDWKPEGWEGDFGWGMGVLIEVDEASRLRVDFSRFGKHWIPAHVTDVVDRANAVRLGEAGKYAPNLVLALGNRLLDPTGRTLRETEVDLLAQRAFVLVFADPRSPDFSGLAERLAPLSARSDVHLVLLPQGGHPDFHVYKASHEAGWKGSFLLDRFTNAYTEGFLEDPTRVPRVEVRTPDGRRVWQSGGETSAAALDRLFGT